MSVLGSAMVCQPEIHKPNLAISQSPSKPFMSQGRLRGPTTSLWPFGQTLTHHHEHSGPQGPCLVQMPQLGWW